MSPLSTFLPSFLRLRNKTCLQSNPSSLITTHVSILPNTTTVYSFALPLPFIHLSSLRSLRQLSIRIVVEGQGIPRKIHTVGLPATHLSLFPHSAVVVAVAIPRTIHTQNRR